ncbi:MAG TPA: hypothetical protein VIP56_00565 [Nitrososphaeraceae archaeon]
MRKTAETGCCRMISSKRKESKPNAIDEKQFNPMLIGLLEVQGMITSRILPL